jgi:hypothetical protein
MASEPDVTYVTAAVTESIGDIQKLNTYELQVAGRHESLTDEFVAAVQEKLHSANLI